MPRAPARSLAERRPDVLRRFLAHVAPGPDGCQLWTGRAPGGVPRFYFHGARSARHFALLLAGRRLHQKVQRLVTSCGSRLCVADAHVVIVSKTPPIKKQPKKVLSEATKRAIRERRHAGVPLRTVAQEFGVHVGTVSAIAGALRPKDKEKAA